jgi:hypothetical protein
MNNEERQSEQKQGKKMGGLLNVNQNRFAFHMEVLQLIPRHKPVNWRWFL